MLKSSRQPGCAFQDIEPQKSNLILRKGTKSQGPKRRMQFSNSALRHMKIWERMGPSQGVIQHTSPHERSLQAPRRDFETKAMRPQRRVGNGKMYSQSQREGQSYILVAFGCLVSTSAIRNETRRKIICCRFRSLDAHVEQESSEFSWTGDRWSIQNPNNGYCSHWEKCKQMKKQQCSSTIWIYSWQHRSSKIRQQFHRWGNSAKTTDISVSGPVVQKPHLIKKKKKNGGKYDATRRITYLSLFRACQPHLPASRVHPQHRCRRTPCEMILRQVQQPHEVKVHTVEHWETSCEIPQKPKTHMDSDGERGSPLRDLPEWLEEFTDNLVDAKAAASSEAPASISREPLHQEPPIKMVSGKHSFFIHFPKHRNCEVCMRTKVTGNQVPRAEKFSENWALGLEPRPTQACPWYWHRPCRVTQWIWLIDDFLVEGCFLLLLRVPLSGREGVRKMGRLQ